jgi:hypothetical protein
MSDEEAETPVSTADSYAITKRLQKEGRWFGQAEQTRDQMMRECKGRFDTKEQAQQWVYGELDRMYPPPEPEPVVVEPEAVAVEGVSIQTVEPAATEPVADAGSHARTRDGHLAGLDQIPADWLPLTDNAALPVELSWVQAQRLRIVEERPNGSTVVHLDRAGSPAPSWAALGWLETSIRSYAKFIEICAKGLTQQDHDSDMVKRERRSIAEVRSLLEEMRNK